MPVGCGGALRVLGPPPDQAAVAVETMVAFDKPLGVLQAYLAGLCRADGSLVQPVEVLLILDPTSGGPTKEVPAAALVRAARALPSLYEKLPVVPGTDLVRKIMGRTDSIGPLLFCRKRHRLFEARSPNNAEPLGSPPSSDETDHAGSDGDQLAPELLAWDGPADGTPVSIYGGAGGATAVGEAQSLEQLILDQGKVVEKATLLARDDPVAANRLALEHTCCACPERKRCFPAGGGYAYALDRLVVVNAAETPVTALPLGEWRLGEVAKIIGGAGPRAVLEQESAASNEFEHWRRERAREVETSGPPLLLAGETDGRQLLELARVKLALIADTLDQLDAAWRATQAPHLCWNDDTVRVTWRRPVSCPAAYWGFQPLLRKIGLQPLSRAETPEGVAVPCPPAFSEQALLPPEVPEAARYFGDPRTATVYVKSSKPAGENAADVHVLLEELGIARKLICRDDVMSVVGEGWEAKLKPAPEHDPDDGEGLPFIGRATGKVGGLQATSQIEGSLCVWYPFFGEAVDLHALGMLLFEMLISHDERNTTRLRDEILAEREELTSACLAVPAKQRDDQARGWIAARCDVDTPAALWSRRKLLYDGDERASAQLDGFPTNLWKAIVTFGFRTITSIPGFSFCPDRSYPAPRTTGGGLLPLVELRGLISFLDDLIFGRATPGESLRATLKGGA